MKLINLSTIPHDIQFQTVFIMILPALKPQTSHGYVHVAQIQKERARYILFGLINEHVIIRNSSYKKLVYTTGCHSVATN